MFVDFMDALDRADQVCASTRSPQERSPPGIDLEMGCRPPGADRRSRTARAPSPRKGQTRAKPRTSTSRDGVEKRRLVCRGPRLRLVIGDRITRRARAHVRPWNLGNPRSRSWRSSSSALEAARSPGRWVRDVTCAARWPALRTRSASTIPDPPAPRDGATRRGRAAGSRQRSPRQRGPRPRPRRVADGDAKRGERRGWRLTHSMSDAAGELPDHLTDEPPCQPSRLSWALCAGPSG